MPLGREGIATIRQHSKAESCCNIVEMPLGREGIVTLSASL